MPCMSISYVTVTGPTEKVAEFMAAVGDGSGFLSTLLPPPADLEDHPDSRKDEVLAARFRQLYGSVDSDEWIREHWGLRRDADLEDMFHQDFGASAGLTGTLQTADAAPLTAFDAIAANYPQLRFDLLFEEEFTGGGGEVSWEGGVEVHFKEEQSVCWCEWCGSRVYEAVLFPPGNAAVTCVNCLLVDARMMADASLVVSADSRATLDSIRSRITAASTVGELLIMDPGEVVHYLLLSQVEEASPGSMPDLTGDVDFPKGSEMNHQVFHTEYTADGRLLVTYPSVYGDDGQLLWGGLSEEHPDATFELTLTPRVKCTPDRFTHGLVAGDRIDT